MLRRTLMLGRSVKREVDRLRAQERRATEDADARPVGQAGGR